MPSLLMRGKKAASVMRRFRKENPNKVLDRIRTTGKKGPFGTKIFRVFFTKRKLKR